MIDSSTKRSRAAKAKASPGSRGQLHYQAQLLAELHNGPGIMGELLARMDAPSRLGPSYGWAAVQLQEQGKIVRSNEKPYVWSLATEAERPKVERVEIDQAAVILTWQRRQTAGNTWRLELTSHLEGAEKPAFSISIFPTDPPSRTLLLEGEAIARQRALNFWRAWRAA